MPLSDVGPYEVLRLIKSGGEASVYAAVDRRLGRRVALKQRRLPDNRDERQAIVSEARLLATLSHPNIVQLFDVIETPDSIVLVMEYVGGSDLEELLAVTRLELSAALQVAVDLCSALSEAHTRGVIHGDLKPANVLVDSIGRIKLTDFGVAFHEHEAARGGGTPSALSPEQRAGECCDARSDLFALGCLFYRLLSGRHPFGKLLSGAADNWHQPASLRSLGVRLPEHLDSVTASLLSIDPAGRPASALQVRRDMLATARDYPAGSGPPLARVVGALGSEGMDEELPGPARETADSAGFAGAAWLKPPLAWSVVAVIIGIVIGAGFAAKVSRVDAAPIAVYLEPSSVEAGGGASPSAELLDSTMRDAVARDPAFAIAGRRAGATRLQLLVRCNEAICASKLLLGDSEAARADTRALLPDADEQEWRLCIEQGLALLAARAE